MGRHSRLNEAEVFAVVGRQLSELGHVTLQSVVSETGVSIGSLYHRYGSREGLLAQAWLDAAQVFQERFLGALAGGNKKAGENAALVTPQFCRDEAGRATILACCRKSEFISDATGEDIQGDINRINKELIEVVDDYAKIMGYSRESCQLGLVAFPLGAVRMYLPRKAVPASVDDYVLEAYRGAIRIGKRK